jgi:hypothetical protein
MQQFYFLHEGKSKSAVAHSPLFLQKGKLQHGLLFFSFLRYVAEPTIFLEE